MKNSDLFLRNYKINRIEYNFKSQQNSQSDDKPIEIEPNFNRTIVKIDDDNLIVSISVSIKDDKMPFDLFVEISGEFNLPKWESDEKKKGIAYINTVAILFPYLRQAVTTTTSLGGVAPLMLPIVNVFSLFDEKSEN